MGVCIPLRALGQGRGCCLGSLSCWSLRESGIYSPCVEKAEPCSWAASLGDAKSQPRLFVYYGFSLMDPSTCLKCYHFVVCFTRA